ncbi:MAG: hypothetical protein J6Y53_05605 [Alphaproteobacteria bacterium]|nr:hypothetical protein [Alphaproteobacteria bacterium]
MKKNNLIMLFVPLFLGACSACVDCSNGNCDKYYSLWCNQSAKPEVKQSQTIPAAPVVAAKQNPTIVVDKQVVYTTEATPTIMDNDLKYYVVEQNPSCISESSFIKAPLVDKNVQVDEEEYKAFAKRVSVKDSKDGTTSYHYRDVRVDEMMPLAARYCREHGNRTAILRKINLYHGYYRRISFDCVNL